jgi:pyruvate/2-oxoglutarate dehydrogenase complex dihydrolipoamide dehydrogenase (E3) component
MDVVVIGGGPAGVTAALRARELGAEVTLVERGRLGGTCTNDGCVPTRVLAHTARLIRDARQHAEYGLAGEPPVLDFARLMDKTQEVVEAVHAKKQLRHHLESVGIRLLDGAGPAQFVDERTIRVGESGRRLSADRFIICAGGHARRLSFPGAEHTMTHSDIWQLRELPRSVAIIGAAATGCQLASVLQAFGSEVTLLDLAPQILPTEDSAVAETMAALFTRRGIHIVTGIEGVERVEPVDGGLRLTYKHAGNLVQAVFTAVVVAVGWPGNVDPLNLAAAGVRTEKGYIVNDVSLRTSVPHIYAAGDIDGRLMLVQSATYEGRIAAENAVLGEQRDHQPLVVPHGGFTDPEYGSVGLTEQQVKEDGIDHVVALASYANLDRAVIDGQPEGFCKIVVDRATNRILGGHVVGEQAVEVVHLLAAHMAAGAPVEQLAALELAYPTYVAVVGLAARRAVYHLGQMELAPQWREIGTHYAAEWERRAQ